MSDLRAELAQRIQRSGPLPVADYMRLCLLHPEHGYYRARPAIGAGGDFVTAPEISQIFGELIGLWCAELWSTMGRPAMVRLVELGPGRGTLMADALRAAATAAPDFRAAIDLHLVEVSRALRERQAAALAAAQPRWHDSFAAVPDGPVLVIANEFFDALPVRQILRTADGWRERAVDCIDGRLGFTAGAAADPPELPDVPASEGSIVESSPEGERWARDIAVRVAGQGGAALVIDYGPLARGPGDTLQAVQAHKKVEPLTDPGSADLTAHVDFAGLAAAARADGAAAHGPVPQAVFLHRLGLAARAATLLRTATPRQARDIEAGVRRLIDPAEMGTLFKALAITDPRHPVPPGFDPPVI